MMKNKYLVAAIPVSHDALAGLGELEEESTIDGQPVLVVIIRYK